MIVLDVAPYCHECRWFDPALGSHEIHAFDGAVFRLDDGTVVRCSDAAKCERVAKYILDHPTACEQAIRGGDGE